MAVVVNVFGTARSGSTVLDLLLGNAENAFSCGEISAWLRPYRKHHFEPDCSCGIHPCPFWEGFYGIPERRIHESLIRTLNLQFLIDSSKDLAWLIDMQKWSGPGGYSIENLVVWKRPIALAHSFWKRSQDIRAWREAFVGSYGKFLETGMPFSAVNFDELAAAPQDKIPAICAAIKMPYSEDRWRAWKRDHHYLFGSGGVRRQIASGSLVLRAQEEPYPHSFLDAFERAFGSIDKDSRVQRIIRVLREADVSNPERPHWPTGGGQPRYHPPLWYYGKKLVRAWRRHHPERYDVTVE